MTYDNGRAPFTPGVRPEAHLPNNERALPEPSKIASQVITATVKAVHQAMTPNKPIMLHDKSHADFLEEARRRIERTETSVVALEWLVYALLAAVFIVVVWMLAVRLLRRKPD